MAQLSKEEKKKVEESEGEVDCLFLIIKKSLIVLFWGTLVAL